MISSCFFLWLCTSSLTIRAFPSVGGLAKMVGLFVATGAAIFILVALSASKRTFDDMFTDRITSFCNVNLTHLGAGARNPAVIRITW
jgi:hypothetical protein